MHSFLKSFNCLEWVHGNLIIFMTHKFSCLLLHLQADCFSCKQIRSHLLHALKLVINFIMIVEIRNVPSLV